MNNNHQKLTPAPLHSQPVYDENPTLLSRADATKRRRAQLGNDRKGILIDQDSGEIIGEGGAIIYELEEVDDERFIKLYMGGLKNATGMSVPAQTVLEEVYNQVQSQANRDFALLSAITCKMSQPQFSRGLRELLAREFLFRSNVAGQFWVNTRFMYNGDRLAFIKAYKRKPKSDPKQTDLIDFIGDK